MTGLCNNKGPQRETHRQTQKDSVSSSPEPSGEALLNGKPKPSDDDEDSPTDPKDKVPSNQSKDKVGANAQTTAQKTQKSVNAVVNNTDLKNSVHNHNKTTTTTTTQQKVHNSVQNSNSKTVNNSIADSKTDWKTVKQKKSNVNC